MMVNLLPSGPARDHRLTVPVPSSVTAVNVARSAVMSPFSAKPAIVTFEICGSSARSSTVMITSTVSLLSSSAVPWGSPEGSVARTVTVRESPPPASASSLPFVFSWPVSLSMSNISASVPPSV